MEARREGKQVGEVEERLASREGEKGGREGEGDRVSGRVRGRE